METPHAVLGLAPSATAEEITRAYRKLVRRYPPELALQQFARVHRAYELLTSPALRMEAARTAPEEAIDQLFPEPQVTLKPPAPPPPPVTAEDLEPLLTPYRRVLLTRLLRGSFGGGSDSGGKG